MRAFYFNELGNPVRQQVSRQLSEAQRAGAGSAELIRTAFKPVLESGPRRYKVIDELLAIKEVTSSLPPERCYAVLRELVD